MRFGTATPNPDLGPERATNLKVGWSRDLAGARLAAALFYSDVRDLIQTILLPDSTTQTHNVGSGEFAGLELSADAPIGSMASVGGNYTYIHRTISSRSLRRAIVISSASSASPLGGAAGWNTSTSPSQSL